MVVIVVLNFATIIFYITITKIFEFKKQGLNTTTKSKEARRSIQNLDT